mgnify:CR=1 FL=1
MLSQILWYIIESFPVVINNCNQSLNENGNSISHGGSWLGAVTYIYRKLDTNGMLVLLESSTSKYSYEIRKEIQRVLNNTEPHMFNWKEIDSKNY